MEICSRLAVTPRTSSFAAHDSNLHDTSEYLLTRCEGTIGELTHLLTDAAVAAIETGEEAINQRTLLLASYSGPTQRRRCFERELL